MRTRAPDARSEKTVDCMFGRGETAYRPASPDVRSPRLNPPIVEWVHEIERALGESPRQLRTLEQSKFSTPRPPWCVPSDSLLKVRTDRRRLLATGDIKLAAILRYDGVLEERSPVHATADVVYAADQDAALEPQQLAVVRDELLAVARGGTLDGDELIFRDFFGSTDQRGFGVRVPMSIAGEQPVALSSLIVYRHYLPGAVLTRRLLPIIVASEPPRIALPIPKSFWPNDMYDWWLAS